MIRRWWFNINNRVCVRVCCRPVWRGILPPRESPGLLLSHSTHLQAQKWTTQTANGKPLGECWSKFGLSLIHLVNRLRRRVRFVIALRDSVWLMLGDWLSVSCNSCRPICHEITPTCSDTPQDQFWLSVGKFTGNYTYHMSQYGTLHLATPCITHMFHTILAINTDYLPKQHWQICQYNGDAVCSLLDRNWIFICNIDERR
jgi:hypothetical protein